MDYLLEVENLSKNIENQIFLWIMCHFMYHLVRLWALSEKMEQEKPQQSVVS